MRRKISPSRLVSRLDPSGLSDSQVAAQRRLYGDNAIAERRQSALVELIRNTLKDPMIWFLVVAASLFFLIGENRDAVTLLLAMLPLIGMDAFLHWRTSRSTQTLRTHLSAQVVVQRNQKRSLVPAHALVPGDIVFIKPNDFIPADCLLIQTEAVQMDESPLTGESLPIAKQPLQDLPLGAEPFVDSIHWAWAGTKLLSGTATLKVAYTGSETLYGEIIQSVEATDNELTPLQKDISRLMQKLLIAALFFCIVLAMARIMEGKGLIDARVGAATLAVAAIPEEFPVVFTFFLGVGVYRMARQKALVRRAVSVENIGRISCLCTDKTGTITEGRLRLAHLRPGRDHTDKELLEAALRASRIESSDPMDQAIFEAVHLAVADLPSVALFPFTEARRRETAALRYQESLLFFCKGSPEMILAMCALSSDEARRSLDMTQELAREGHKVIACAKRAMPAVPWDGAEPTSGFDFLGLLAFEDPIRGEVPAAVASCQRAGIHILMITGDHPETAATVAREIGLGWDNPRLVNAETTDLAAKDCHFFLNTDVVARALPAQKLEIVSILKQGGERVAVTGDGINDVPALKAADVGLAMGARGTRAAREIASIVISDDNFASIVSAIREGRQLLQNLRISFQYLIAVHIPLVSTAALIPLLGYPLLYLPIHIVWLELIIHPTALFAFQERSSPHLQRLAKDQAGKTFARQDWILCLALGIMIAIAVGTAYGLGIRAADGGIKARTLAIATLIFSESMAASLLSKLHSRSAQLIAGVTILLSVWLIMAPFARGVLHVIALGSVDWITVILLSCFATTIPYGLVKILSRNRWPLIVMRDAKLAK